MPPPRLALADELAAVRIELARLSQREAALASIEPPFPVVAVFTFQGRAARKVRARRVKARENA
jgi:hypothetical protein